MYYKISKGTETFKKLMELKKKVEGVNKQANAAVGKLNGQRYAKAQGKLAGGISAIEYKEKPDGWKQVGNTWQNLYAPKSTTKAAWEIINVLPTIEYDELNKIVNFKAPQTVSSDGGIAWVSTVGIAWGDKQILMEVTTGCKYKPLPDIVEIVESEYMKLKPKDKKEK
jgi:hypothetical protein